MRGSVTAPPACANPSSSSHPDSPPYTPTPTHPSPSPMHPLRCRHFLLLVFRPQPLQRSERRYAQGQGQPFMKLYDHPRPMHTFPQPIQRCERRLLSTLLPIHSLNQSKLKRNSNVPQPSRNPHPNLSPHPPPRVLGVPVLRGRRALPTTRALSVLR